MELHNLTLKYFKQFLKGLINANFLFKLKILGFQPLIPFNFRGKNRKYYILPLLLLLSMTTTKISNKEFLQLNQQIIKTKKKINPIEVFDNHKKVLCGSPKHQRIGNYIISLLIKNKFKYNTEVGYLFI